METHYKGFKISYSEFDNTWDCSELDIRDKKSMKEVKERIDITIARDHKVKIPVIKWDYEQEIIGEITSINNNSFWVSYTLKNENEKRRRKEELKYTNWINKTDENVFRIVNIIALQNQINSLTKEKNELIKNLPKLALNIKNTNC